MGEFRRKPGESLGLSLDLRPDPQSTRFVRAFLFDKNGSAFVPAFLDLADAGGGTFVDNTFTMPSTPQIRAKYRVYLDAAYTEEDCEYLGSEDVFDLDELVPSQLPSDVSLTAEVFDGKIEAIASDERMIGQMETKNLTGIVEDSDDLETSKQTPKLSASASDEKLSGEIEDC